MNLFLLSKIPKLIAQYHCDKHIVKMILELTQMLYTAYHKLHNNDKWIEKCQNKVYKPTHRKHPITLWVGSHINNYKFATEVGIELCKEFKKRYKKEHACCSHIKWLKNNPPKAKLFKLETSENSYYAKKGLPDGVTPYPLAMPSKYHQNDAVKAYRDYYKNDKLAFACWKYSKKPYWF